MKIVWFATQKEADAYEAQCAERARALAQKCERWAEVIVDKVNGFGVPVKDRIAVQADAAKVVEWQPIDTVKA